MMPPWLAGTSVNWERVYEDHAGQLAGYLAKLVGDREVACELTKEAFLRALKTGAAVLRVDPQVGSAMTDHQGVPRGRVGRRVALGGGQRPLGGQLVGLPRRGLLPRPLLQVGADREQPVIFEVAERRTGIVKAQSVQLSKTAIWRLRIQSKYRSGPRRSR